MDDLDYSDLGPRIAMVFGAIIVLTFAAGIVTGLIATLII